jgi:hypothetical protein
VNTCFFDRKSGRGSRLTMGLSPSKMTVKNQIKRHRIIASGISVR